MPRGDAATRAPAARSESEHGGKVAAAGPRGLIMIVGILQMELRISESHSLKDKRMVLKSLKDRLRQRFNISVSEIGHQEKWQRALVGVTGIGTDRTYVNGLLSAVLDWVSHFRSVELVSSQMEML